MMKKNKHYSVKIERTVLAKLLLLVDVIFRDVVVIVYLVFQFIEIYSIVVLVDVNKPQRHVNQRDKVIKLS